MRVALEELVGLQGELRAVDPNAVIPRGFFGGLIQEAQLTREEVEELFHLLRLEGVVVPSFAALVGDDSARGHARRGGGAGKSPAQVMLDELQDTDEAADAIAAQIESKLAVTTLLREQAEAFGVSIDVILNNWERLAPAAGAVLLSAELFGQSLQNLQDIIDFRPATGGVFGVGDVINGIEVATRTIEGKTDELDKVVRIRGAEYAEMLRTNLNQIARFETNLAILFLRGQETLAQHLLEGGPGLGQVAADMVSNFNTAAETEHLLETGGSPPEALLEKYDEVLGSAPIPPGFLDFISQFGSNTVQKRAYDDAFATGQQYGSGLTAGIIAALAPWVLALLGVSGSINAATGFTIIGAPPPTPTVPGPSGEIRNGFVINQTFNTEPRTTPETQQAMQQAAALAAVAQ
jgi:hypothetical protein